MVITPRDEARSLDLKLNFAFGVCREICIPAEARLNLLVPQGVSLALPRALTEALDHAPRRTTARRSGDPELVGHEVVLGGEQPRIVLELEFPGGADQGDVFAEAPDGLYLPMAQRLSGHQGETARFVIELRESFEPEELKGRTLTLTLVGAEGQSERKLPLN